MPVYTNPIIDQEPSPKVVYYIDNKCALFTCNGSPEGVILANTGSIALSDNGSVFKKTTDDVNTGWVELTGGTQSSPFNISGANPSLNLIDTTGGDDDATISLDADQLSLFIVGGTPVILKSSGQFIGYPKCIHSSTVNTGNVGAGLDTIRTITIPANTLATDQDFIEFILSGVIAVNDNNKRFVLSFSGVTLLDTGLNDLDGFGFHFLCSITRLTATTIAFTIQTVLSGTVFDGAGAIVGAGTASLGHLLRNNNATAIGGIANMTTNPSDIVLQAEAVADNDVVMTKSRVYLIQMT